jgi:hypothetical protein
VTNVIAITLPPDGNPARAQRTAAFFFSECGHG